eukprot:tig00021312_g20068.t1
MPRRRGPKAPRHDSPNGSIATYWVRAGGDGKNAFPTVAAAWEKAKRDHPRRLRGSIEIRVSAGTHVFPGRTTLQASNCTVVVVGDPDNATILQSLTPTRALFLVRGNSAVVTFKNLELCGSTLLMGEGCTWRFENCVVDGQGSVGVLAASSEGGRAPAAPAAPLQSALSFEACRIAGCRPQHGVVCDLPCTIVEVRRSEISACNHGVSFRHRTCLVQVAESVVRGCAVGVAFTGPRGDVIEAGCVRNTTFAACRERLRIQGRGPGFTRLDNTNVDGGEEESPLQLSVPPAVGPRHPLQETQEGGANPALSAQVALLEEVLSGGAPSSARGLLPPDVTLRVHPRPGGTPGQSASEPQPSEAAPAPIEFRAHAFFLQLHSNYFRAMLAAGMTEAQSGIVNVNEFDADTVRTFVRFCYTGELRVPHSEIKPENLPPGVTAEEARARAHLDLARAAHYFDSPRLGGVAVEALAVAEQLGDRRLRALALRRAVETRKAAVRSADFRALLGPLEGPEARGCPRLVLELARALADLPAGCPHRCRSRRCPRPARPAAGSGSDAEQG